MAVPAPASELAYLTPAEIRQNQSDTLLPEPLPAFEESALTSSELREEAAGRSGTAPSQDAVPATALSAALAARHGKDPVVITVAGLRFGEIGWGSLELRNFLRLVNFFTRNTKITEGDLVNGVVAFNPRYFFPDRDAEAESRAPRMPDNYLEQKLKEIPGYEQHDVIVLPYAWSRDPGDSRAAIAGLEKKIEETWDAFKDSGRPIYILAHSWGSVLSHTALHRVAARRPDVRIDKFITAGSPLMPGNFVVKLFMKLEVRKERLAKRVSKPAIVRSWSNFWALRDAYSNAIPAADFNFQADESVENVEPTLIDLILHKKPMRKQARKDLFLIRDIKAWHGAYFFDYKASLKSIEKEIAVEVFRPAVAPQVVKCDISPAPMCVP